MSQPPFDNSKNSYADPNNLKNSYADPRQSPAYILGSEPTIVNEGNHGPEYGLGIMGHTSYDSSGFYPESHMDYQQNNQPVTGPTLHDMSITDRSLEPYSYYLPISTINHSLSRSPGPAGTFSTVPDTQVTESTISRPGGNNSYQCARNCTGNNECEHRGISKSQQLPSVADRGSDARTMSSQPRQNKHRRKVPCPIYGCNRGGDNGFSRKDNLRQHLRGVHEENIPKQRRGGAAHGGV